MGVLSSVLGCVSVEDAVVREVLVEDALKRVSRECADADAGVDGLHRALSELAGKLDAYVGVSTVSVISMASIASIVLIVSILLIASIVSWMTVTTAIAARIREVAAALSDLQRVAAALSDLQADTLALRAGSTAADARLAHLEARQRFTWDTLNMVHMSVVSADGARAAPAGVRYAPTMDEIVDRKQNLRPVGANLWPPTSPTSPTSSSASSASGVIV
jgi:hypothetical protein